jgi:hypothetical protein
MSFMGIRRAPTPPGKQYLRYVAQFPAANAFDK